MRKKIEIELINHTSGTREIRGLNGENGKDGETPSDERLIALIEPRIPKLKQPKDGKSPTKTEIKEIIKEVLPEDKLIEKIVQKVPKIKGDKGDKGDIFRFADLTPYEKQVLTGPQGSNGVGVPRYGTAGQVLAKSSSRDFDTEWVTGGGGAVDSVNGQTGIVVLDADDIDETASRIWFTTAEETKLGGIETGAEVNTIDTVSDTTEIDLAITARDLTATIRSGSIDETKLDTSVNASLDLADTAVQPAGLSGYELLANKATDFTTINNTLYPTVQAVNTAINTAVTGLLDYRGSYDASTNLFPATGGSGILGAILSGDFWICSVPGTLGGTPVTNGDLIIAIVDTPGQTAGNWDLIENTLGYTPENVANKENTTIDTNTTKYPTVNLLKTGLDTKQATLVSGTNIKTVNSTTLLGSGDLAVATTAQGALADSALQPGDIASGTITARADDINFSGGSDGDVLTVQADGSLALEAAAGGGANTALSNLASVAINTTLVSDTDNTDDLGTTLKKWANLFVTTIGATATRVTKGWFTDLEVTNAIAGSITGNAATVTTNANLTGDVTSTGNVTTIANSAVTLAKMANLAQDQFIGRTTASTGVPETATITAAARTVLDDTTVGAMVDTLGGATSTGTGGLVRTGSPALVTPSMAAIVVSGGTLTLPTGASDTLVSKNSTDTLTNKSISGGQITSAVATATTATGTNALYSATTTVNVNSATAPTSGQVLTATSSTAATWQTPSSPLTVEYSFSTAFETLTRTTSQTSGGGNAVSITSGGLYCNGGSAAGYASGKIRMGQSNGFKVFSGNPKFSAQMYWQYSKSGGNDEVTVAFCGIGDPGISLTSENFTTNHIGFMVTSTAGGALNLYATNANGSTQTKSASLETAVTGTSYEFFISVTSDTNIAYYWRKNGGSWSSVLNHTTNIPSSSTSEQHCTVGLIRTDAISGSDNDAYIGGMTYKR